MDLVITSSKDPTIINPTTQICSFAIANKKTMEKAADFGESYVVREMGYLIWPEILFPPILF